MHAVSGRWLATREEVSSHPCPRRTRLDASLTQPVAINVAHGCNSVNAIVKKLRPRACQCTFVDTQSTRNLPCQELLVRPACKLVCSLACRRCVLPVGAAWRPGIGGRPQGRTVRLPPFVGVESFRPPHGRRCDEEFFKTEQTERLATDFRNAVGTLAASGFQLWDAEVAWWALTARVPDWSAVNYKSVGGARAS